MQNKMGLRSVAAAVVGFLIYMVKIKPQRGYREKGKGLSFFKQASKTVDEELDAFRGKWSYKK